MSSKTPFELPDYSKARTFHEARELAEAFLASPDVSLTERKTHFLVDIYGIYLEVTE